MNGESGELAVATIRIPRRRKTETIGTSHQSFFSHKRLNNCLTVLDFDDI